MAEALPRCGRRMRECVTAVATAAQTHLDASARWTSASRPRARQERAQVPRAGGQRSPATPVESRTARRGTGCVRYHRAVLRRARSARLARWTSVRPSHPRRRALLRAQHQQGHRTSVPNVRQIVGRMPDGASDGLTSPIGKACRAADAASSARRKACLGAEGDTPTPSAVPSPVPSALNAPPASNPMDLLAVNAWYSKRVRSPYDGKMRTALKDFASSRLYFIAPQGGHGARLRDGGGRCRTPRPMLCAPTSACAAPQRVDSRT